MSAGKLPEGWVNLQLDDIATDISYGYTASSSSERVGPQMLRITDIQNNTVNWSNVPFCHIDDHQKEKYLLANGDLVFARTGATVGKSFLIKGTIPESVYASYLIRVRCHKYIDIDFLAHFFQSPKYWNQITEFSSGIGQPNVNGSKLKKLYLPLPSGAEQKTIAEKLDTLLAQVDSTKARLEQIPKILKRFRQAVLAAATSGGLTQDWRKNNELTETAEDLLKRWMVEREGNVNQQYLLLENDKVRRNKKTIRSFPPDLVTGTIPTIPDSWKIVSISQFADCLDSQRIPVKKENRMVSEGKYPYFGANGEVDRVDEYIFDGDYVLVTEDETFYGRVKPIAYRYTGKCWVNNHVHILSAPTKIANDYLSYALMYYRIIPWLTGTTGRAKLTQGALNVLPIGLPPENEMIEIVRRVEQLFAYADTIEKQVNAALARVNNLTQSILAKAFRGELTAQWRAENPDLISGENSAAALLEKIKAERAASTGKKAPRKKA
ncbi:restriction endonuclease subunit S [Kosakonia radicincitans]|uniref:restriction endonuclease subunit S n=1 Tax=Kosakonia radicincitans TaxID=283686 RepID=UPI002367ADDE|nr:restriction endonuclease subunit S [Kosakonia radicincitans]MDD7994869.1 restriction endonuclease subunit S [Kosakonia radicincitans]